MSTTMAKIIHLCLGLSVCCLTSQSLSVTLVKPGENISIDCHSDTGQVHWYLQRSGRPPAPILRSFGGALPGAFYYDTGLQSKYSLQAGNRLFIHNFTTEDCTTYYCGVLDDGVLRFFNGTRLNCRDLATGLQNLTSCTQMEQQCTTICYPFFIAAIIISLILVVLILVFAGMLKRSNNCRPAKTLEEPWKHGGLTYSETEMSAVIYTELMVPVSAHCNY